MSIESSNVEQKYCEPRRHSKKWPRLQKERGVEPRLRGGVGWKSHIDQFKKWSWVYNQGILSPVWGLLGKPKATPRELMLKVDNIIPLWRFVIPNMVSSHALNLVMSIESSNVEQKYCESRRHSKKWLRLQKERGVEARLRGGVGWKSHID